MHRLCPLSGSCGIYLLSGGQSLIFPTYADGLFHMHIELATQRRTRAVVPSKDPEYLSIVLVIGPLNPWEEAWPSERPHTTYTWPKL